MTVSVGSFVVSRPEVAAREIADGAVLVNVNSGGCFELNRVGFEIWQLLQKKTTISEICEALAGRYPVARDTLATDARDLIQSLVHAGLVDLSDA